MDGYLSFFITTIALSLALRENAGSVYPFPGVPTGTLLLRCPMRNFVAALVSVSLLSSAWAQDPPASLPAEPGASVQLPTPGTVLSSVPASELLTSLAQLTTMPVFSRSTIALEVVDAASGARLYSWGDDRVMLPASTQKLVTSAVALRTLGPAYRFPTWIKVDAPPTPDGILEGNLYVVGQGDPTMSVERIWRIVADIRHKGIVEITGDVVYDDTYNAGPGVWIPGWDKADDLESGEAYYAALGALSVNENIAAIHVRPGAAIGAAGVATFDTPSDVIVLDNQLTTGRAKSKYWVKIERTLDEKTSRIATYKLTGNVPIDLDITTRPLVRTLADPTGNYLSIFRDMLKSHGIKVRGKQRVAVAPLESTLLVKAESERLSGILTDMNKRSNNFIAEQVLRAVAAETVGLPGTTENGVKVMSEYLASLGVPPHRYKFVNGSGLARGSMLAPSALDAMLVDMYGNIDLRPEYLTTLSVGGRDGTLASRFRDDGMEGRVRAKTGSLAGVFCLAGYVTALDGTNYAFTFLVNDLEGSTARARAAHDRFVRSLAGVTGNLAEAGDGGAD